MEIEQEVVAAMQEVYGTDNYANTVNDNFHDLQDKPLSRKGLRVRVPHSPPEVR